MLMESAHQNMGEPVSSVPGPAVGGGAGPALTYGSRPPHSTEDKRSGPASHSMGPANKTKSSRLLPNVVGLSKHRETGLFRPRASR